MAATQKDTDRLKMLLFCQQAVMGWPLADWRLASSKGPNIVGLSYETNRSLEFEASDSHCWRSDLLFMQLYEDLQYIK